ncbi:Lipid A export ATP-binding/permease protein MsbA [Candidatus Methanomethylophilus alvi Mx1201]|uniref:Lipid A export ATP-binding/permease protein MsbA n=2 Tax=Methanomethylophilus alvi TaxID=1291540 RepID=M9SH74_METAX|nr:ABC transporter ATP-binding protein [Methanomethylophilus alvi]AGI85503.1 Lipid A export ATP-binding/permease protein MsbA [Candidatus Methanomethylophilus alvi Mx1201]AYQ54920.1 ABC transporter [Methanomethylophilus alvi]
MSPPGPSGGQTRPKGPRWAVGEKPKDLKGTMVRLLHYIGKYRRDIAFGVVFSITAAVLTLIGPQYLAQVTDLVSGSILGGTSLDLGRIGGICLVLVFIYSASVIFSTCQEYLISASSEKIANVMRDDLSRKINRVPLGYFDRSSTGDIMSRLTNDADTVGNTCSESIALFISSITLAAGSVAMMFYTDPTLAAISIVPTGVGFVLMFVLIKKSQKYYRRQQGDLGAMNGLVEEVYYGHDIVRAYNGEAGSKKRFTAINDSLYTSAFYARFMTSLMPQMLNFISNIGYVIVCIFGSMMVIDGRIGYGVIVAFIVYVNQFTRPILMISESLTSMQSVAAASERIFDFLDAPEMGDEGYKDVSVANVRGEVEFRDVHFSYVPGREVIHGFSQKVEPGQKVAIVGLTGAGKTTIVNLLMRFYEADSGDILIDGIPTRSMTRSQVHGLFCMVLQDTWLFNGTIRDNIAYTKEGVSESDIRAACRAAGIDDFIMGLPDGYDTVLTDGMRLSAGQKQQITIARAIVRDAPLLILDEATSSVDTMTEKHIQNAMDVLMEGRTSFIIAHRLSTVRNADLILVMKDGSIFEKGTHEELMGIGGFYKELYDSQFENCE